jgi:hypothetical protein
MVPNTPELVVEGPARVRVVHAYGVAAPDRAGAVAVARVLDVHV